jgi:hypothetical protein
LRRGGGSLYGYTRMATCPLCRTRLNYLALLFGGERSMLDCKQCGIGLRASVNERLLLPYALISGCVAATLAFSVVLSGDFVATVALLLGWTVVSWAAYPLVLDLAPGARPVPQTESK